MIKKKDLNQKDKKIWEDYIKNPTDVYDKDLSVSNTKRRERYRFDLHGFTLDEYRETITSLDKYLELVLPQDREKYLKHDVKLLEDLPTEAVSIEYRIRRTDGVRRQINVDFG